MGLIAFVANYEDLSTDKGYQFKFFCDKCGNGCLSTYERNTLGTAVGLLEAASSLLGGMLGNVSNSAYQLQRAIGGPDHDAALKRAVEEVKQQFRQCTRCGKWVCPEICWNAGAGLCESCAPDAKAELAAQQQLAASEQIYAKTREQDYTSKIDFATIHNAAPVTCVSCHVTLPENAKFCGECGTRVGPVIKPVCSDCGTDLQGAKFCPQCGKAAR